MVKVAGIDNFGGDVIAGVAAAEVFAGGSALRVGVAGLHHEFVDYSVEEHVVVISLLDKFEEIVAVTGSVGEEAHADVAFGGADVGPGVALLHHGFFGSELRSHYYF